MKNRYTIAAVITLLTLCVLAPAAANANTQASTATVGAWNIQWLGSPQCRPQAVQGVAQSAGDIADFIIASGVDVLGVEEITDDDNSANTYSNKTLTRAMEIIRQKTGQAWTHMLFRKDSGGSNCQSREKQLCGVAWNTSKAQRIGFRKIPLNLSSVPNNVSVWNRHPYAIKFRFGGGADVVLIVVHMKSNLGDNTEVTRQWESKVLVDQLGFVKNFYADDDIIILGDTNVLGANETAVRNYVQAGFSDLNAQDEDTTTRGEPFDRILVRAGQTEFAGSRQDVFGPGYLSLSDQNFLRRLSDHYMVRTRINVASDDD
jgi:hypothetical protein